MYPAVRQPFLVDDQPCDLWVPEESVVQARYEEAKAAEQATEFPYWTRVWSAARVMAQEIGRSPHWVQQKTVLELGAGMGLPSFIAQRYATTVIVSDYIQEAVDWLQRNAEQSKGRVECRVIDWRTSSPLPFFDVLILSDLFYEPSQHARLHSILEETWEAGKIILLATPDRAASKAFVQDIRIPYTVSKIVDCLDNGYASNVLFQVYHQAIP